MFERIRKYARQPFSSGPTELDRQRMVQHDLARRGIRSQRVLDCMARIPRERFVPAGMQHHAYADRALAIDCDQTISQPYIVALMTESLEVEPEHRVLEIGTGSGYQTAVLAELAHDVVSVERHAELSAKARRILCELGYANIRFIVGDGTLGWPAAAPYDRILVTAATNRCPQALLEQLADGGLLVAPVGSLDEQEIVVVRKSGGRLREQTVAPCRFVPLIGEQGFADRGDS